MSQPWIIDRRNYLLHNAVFSFFYLQLFLYNKKKRCEGCEERRVCLYLKWVKSPGILAIVYSKQTPLFVFQCKVGANVHFTLKRRDWFLSSVSLGGWMCLQGCTCVPANCEIWPDVQSPWAESTRCLCEIHVTQLFLWKPGSRLCPCTSFSAVVFLLLLIQSKWYNREIPVHWLKY